MSTDFANFLQEGILSLPEHLKTALRLVDDPDIPDDGRVAIAGALLHWRSGSNSIPGLRGPLSLVDDLLILQLAFEKVGAIAPDAMARHLEDSPEVLGGLTENLALIREALGKGVQVLEKVLEKLPSMKHQGLVASECIKDEDLGNELYEEVQSAMVELELDEDEVARALKGLDELIKNLIARVR